ncbi:MAG: hypothetical protein LBK06_03555 [Planctomycetaceae bacterium]|nr:hypothetical protein [Planctomycetaceae bacterium]
MKRLVWYAKAVLKNSGAEHGKRNNIERLFKGEAYRLTGSGITIFFCEVYFEKVCLSNLWLYL